ncbi:MAG: DUF4384 domain-containing protein [Deltaproteobacteria bacterium]|nr:DUF4384 domain-containing protein [Deltaproteobacteria bacterium]
MESALCDVSDSATPFALGRVEKAVLDGLEMNKSPRFSLRRKLTLAIAGASCALAVLVSTMFFLGQAPSPHRVAFDEQSRLVPVDLLVSKSGTARAEPGVGIRIIRVSPGDDRAREDATLSLDSIITFSYTCIVPGQGYLAIFGIQESGNILWYYPDYDGTESIEISDNKVDEPLGDGFRLSVNHKPGRLRAFSIFSAEPIDVNAIETAVSELLETPGAIEEVIPLKIKGYEDSLMQHSFAIEITK